MGVYFVNCCDFTHSSFQQFLSAFKFALVKRQLMQSFERIFLNMQKQSLQKLGGRASAGGQRVEMDLDPHTSLPKQPCRKPPFNERGKDAR